MGTGTLTGNQPVGGHQITNVLPASLFAMQDLAQVYTPDRIQQELGNIPDLTQLTYAITDDILDDLVAVMVRRGVWIPNSYASLCLEEELIPSPSVE